MKAPGLAHQDGTGMVARVSGQGERFEPLRHHAGRQRLDLTGLDLTAGGRTARRGRRGASDRR